LQKLWATSTRRTRRVVAITDNARYHHARLHRDWREQKAERFRLDFLPPYSPELNAAERIWKLTRRLCIHNRYFRSLAEVAVAVQAEFANRTKPNNTLRRLCAIT
jgi:transposase